MLQHLFLIAKRNHKRQNELIPYNDCLYRNMYRYEYIALLDIDEERVIETFQNHIILCLVNTGLFPGLCEIG